MKNEDKCGVSEFLPITLFWFYIAALTFLLVTPSNMVQNIDIFLVHLMTYQVEKPANIYQHYIMLSFKSLHFSVV